MQYSKYVVLTTLFLVGSSLYFVQSDDQIVSYIKAVTFSVGMGALLALLVDIAAGGKLLTILLEAFNPTFIEHRSGDKASNDFKKAFKHACDIDYLSITFAYPRKKFSKEEFKKKILTGGCIRILIADSKSRFLEERIKHNIVSDVNTLVTDIEETIKFFNELKDEVRKDDKNINGKLHLRVHSELPYRGFSSFDGRCFVTPYLTDNDAAHGPVLEITKSSSLLFKGYKRQFNAFWDKATPVVEIDEFQHSGKMVNHAVQPTT